MLIYQEHLESVIATSKHFFVNFPYKIFVWDNTCLCMSKVCSLKIIFCVKLLFLLCLNFLHVKQC